MLKTDALWFKGIPEDGTAEREKDLLSYRNAFDALREVLVELEDNTPPKADYDSPSWAYKQADRNGANRILNRIRKLITVQEG